MPRRDSTVTTSPGFAPIASRSSGWSEAIGSGSIASSTAERDGPTAVVTVPWTRNERGAVAGLKTTSYAENVVALAHAQRHGASEALFANTAGHLCEGTGSNVFYVLDGELRTPTLASGCLAGISRALLLEWCDDLVEVDEPIEVLDSADEIFLMSTTRDVQGVHRIDDRELESPGPVTQRLRDLWAAKAAEDPDP